MTGTPQRHLAARPPRLLGLHAPATAAGRARLLGGAVAAAGLVDLVSALRPAVAARSGLLLEVFDPAVLHVARGATALAGLGLLLLGRGLARRRRLAWGAAVALLVVSALAHLGKDLDVEEAAVCLALAGVLVHQRRLFAAPVPRLGWRALLAAPPLVLVGAVAYGTLGLLVRASEVEPRPTLVTAAREAALRAVGLAGPLHVGGVFGAWFPASITVLGALGLAGVVLALLAPVAERMDAHADGARLRRLVDTAGGDTLDPFALRADKHAVLSRDGRAAVAYRYVRGVGLASGDPVGDPGSFGDALDRFLERCEAYGWRPAIIGARGDRLDLYRSRGLRCRYLGDEAVVDVASFSLEGRAMRPVRQAVSRTRNFGVRTEVARERELDPTLRRALQGIAERHRNGAPERGFSMALDGLLDGRHGDCVVVVARDASGAPIAFQRYAPCRAGRGLSLDAMRRDPDVPNGTNERMIVEAVEWGRAHGVEVVSLNFAAFRALLDEAGRLGPLDAAQARLVRRLEPYFQIDSLRRFNAKFHPTWVPRWLLYGSSADLLPVALAALSAESFLPFDRREPSPPARRAAAAVAPTPRDLAGSTP